MGCSRVGDARVGLESTSAGGGGGGSGTVTAGTTDNAVARYDGVGSTTLQESPVTIGDSGEVAGARQVDFTPSPAPAFLEGRLFYNQAEHSLSVYTDESTFELTIGQESLVRVANNTGVALTKGQVVYVTGEATEAGLVRPEVTLARADAVATASVLGVILADIPDGDFGWVIDQGVMRGVDTSAFNTGEVVFLSSVTAGALTNVVPAGRGNVGRRVGVVLRKSAGSGILLVDLADLERDDDLLLGGTLGSVTVNTLAERMDRQDSPGLFSGGDITDDGDGTVTVAALAGLIRAADSDVDPLLSFEVAATPITPTDADVTYIYVEYNAGTPQVVGSTTKPTDVNTNLLLGTVYRNGTDLHITNRPVVLASAVRDLFKRFVSVEGLSRASGLDISETGTRSIALTAGELWLGLGSFDAQTGGWDSSGVDTFDTFHRDGVGGWTQTAGLSQLSNTLYDDGTGTLATVGSNRYVVHWIYVAVDDDVYSVYGRGSYTLAQAAEAAPPSDLPPHLSENHAILVGKIIVQDGAASFESIESPFVTQFAGTVVGDHGALAGLGDDDHTQYLLVDGTRAMTGDLDLGSQTIVNAEYGHILHPTIELIEDFSGANYYQAGSNGFAGVATGFFFAALVEPFTRPPATNEIFWSNFAVAGTPAGWGIGSAFNGAIVFVYDTSGAQIGAGTSQLDTLNDPMGGFTCMKHHLILGQLIQSGGGFDLYIWINGQRGPVGTSVNAYQPRTGTPYIGYEPAFGDNADETGVAAVSYLEGTLTDSQIRSWFDACFAAGDIVDDGLGWNIYSAKRGTPGATWTVSDGAGPTLNRTGALTATTRQFARYV